jgi:hypothetical protein
LPQSGQQFEVRENINSMAGAISNHRRIEDIVVASAKHVRSSVHRGRDDEVIVSITTDAWNRLMRWDGDTEGPCVQFEHGLIDLGIIESVNSPNPRIPQRISNIVKQLVGRDEKVRRRPKKFSYRSGGSGWTDDRPHQQIAVQNDPHYD